MGEREGGEWEEGGRGGMRAVGEWGEGGKSGGEGGKSGGEGGNLVLLCKWVGMGKRRAGTGGGNGVIRENGSERWKG